jgi:hypothetical protein
VHIYKNIFSWLAELFSVTGEGVLVTMNGTNCAAMSPFSSCNMLTRRACTLINSLASQWRSHAHSQLLPQYRGNSHAWLRVLRHPSPYGQVARKNKKPKPLKKTLAATLGKPSALAVVPGCLLGGNPCAYAWGCIACAPIVHLIPLVLCSFPPPFF